MNGKVFISWSGGKDSYLSLLKAKDNGLNVGALLTFMNHNGSSMSHGINLELLKQQAASLGLPLMVESVTWDDYEEGFLRITDRLTRDGFTGGVFGDINLPDHREWVEKMCARVGIKAYLPLWGMQEEQVLHELQQRRVKLKIIVIRNDLIAETWLGSYIDTEFQKMCIRKGLTPCGEKGEFHSLVIDGPEFSYPLQVTVGEMQRMGQYSFLILN